jgi:hypothetical protein
MEASTFKSCKKLTQEWETYLHQQLHGGMDFCDFNYLVQLDFGGVHAMRWKDWWWKFLTKCKMKL